MLIYHSVEQWPGQGKHPILLHLPLDFSPSSSPVLKRPLSLHSHPILSRQEDAVDITQDIDRNLSSQNHATGASHNIPSGKKSPMQWEHIFNGIEVPCLVVRTNGTIIAVNEATLRAAKKTKEEVIGQGVCKIIHGGRWPHLPCPLEEFLKKCTLKVEETRLPGLHGDYLLSALPVRDANDSFDTILLTARELTSDEIRKVDYIRNGKLAAIGELAAGVAHEINNPITGIINFAQILLDHYSFDSAGVEIVQKIIEEGERIASITKNLISFAREDISLREPVDPAEIIYSSLALVSHQLKKDGIKMLTHISRESKLIIADFKKIQQVLLNLISNSRYALNRRYPSPEKAKIIEISCFCKKNVHGVRVCKIIVKDYGTGLPQSILDNIFEPFFSTKPPGEGTGLGLSISYGIVKEHEGDMYVNSIMDKFTEMIIELPIKEQQYD